MPPPDPPEHIPGDRRHERGKDQVLEDMQGEAILVRINRHGPNAHLVSRTKHASRNLTTIRDEELGDFLGWHSRYFKAELLDRKRRKFSCHVTIRRCSVCAGHLKVELGREAKDSATDPH